MANDKTHGRIESASNPMRPAPAYERIYHKIKRLLMEGSWPQGMRLDPSKIAAMLSITKSMVPVCDALPRLLGEGMVERTGRQGFYVPRISEAGLRDLLEHNRDLLLAAIKTTPQKSPAIFTNGPNPDQFSSVFLQLGCRSGNAVRCESISRQNDRLYQYRCYDSEIFEDVDSELENILAAANDNPKGAILRRLITRYHNRRIAATRQYIRLMTSHGDRPSSP
ncbi:GntR family transcriptional regulator [Sphingopyxis sp. 22461]|uniref:GntR family transcriptional regulator n=1 Tax=Sphingopyxis sp. 22461 TaxID=3453923 RepID=UPI003F835318